MSFTTFSINDHTFQFSLAKESQAKELFTLVNGGYQTEKTRKEGVTYYSSVEEISQTLKDTDRAFWLVLKHSQNDDTMAVIGSLKISKEKDKYFLGAFAIAPSYKPFKLGKIMLAEVEKFLTQKKVNNVYLEVTSVANKTLNSTKEWAPSEADIEAEEDRLADYYKANGYAFTGSKTIPSLQWQKNTRKPEYVDRVFFREMKKITF